MDDSISRAEHEEFRRRMEDEHERQNKRIGNLEQSFERMQNMTSAVEKLALNMELMLKEQEKQGKRLETLESRDGEMWRKTVGYVLTAIIGIVIGYIFTQIGIPN